MERFFKRKASSSSTAEDLSAGSSKGNAAINIPPLSSTFSTPIHVDYMHDLPWDPCDRPRISQYNVNQRDTIRRKYWVRGPCQPIEHQFPYTTIGKKPRRFMPTWFGQFGNWLEYSIKADRAFCLCCYLFRDNIGGQGGNEAFMTEGFNCWNKTERLDRHVGGVNNFHNRALQKCENLIGQNQSITEAFDKQSDIVKKEYRIRLNASAQVCRLLLNGGLPFRGHNENEESLYKGNFLEILNLVRNQTDIVRDVTLKMPQ